MHRSHRVGMGLLALALFAGGCYGPFNLTRRLHNWNGQIGGKWEKEFVFLVLAWVPVYSLAVLGDAIVFNSMEFWTGNNPVDPPGVATSSTPSQTKRIARGDAEALLTYTPSAEGAQLLIQQFQHGQAAGSLRVEQRNGSTVGIDASGQVVFTAQTLPNGNVMVSDREGKQVALYDAGQL